MLGEDYIKRVSWNEVGTYLNCIAQRIDPHDFTGVYGIPRGGSVLAAWLSHKLYLPLLSEPKEDCIIIDDICDSGKTLKEFVESDINYYITVMLHRIENGFNIAPDYYFKPKTDNWAVFPWEE